jgi:predicted amidophosphoribosyltransferase
MKKNYFLFFFQKIKNFIKDMFYFSVCSYCKAPIDNRDKKYSSLCLKCIFSISHISPVRHKKTSFLVYSLGKYDGVLRYIVTEKYRKNSMAYEGIVDKIITMITIFNIDFDYILPVPKTSINKVKHQLNQTLIIAESISNYYNKKIFDYIYIKKNKKDQAVKKFSERILMDNDIFFIPESKKYYLSKKKILIIDDVYTTGSTIDSIINALLKIDYISITILVLARK